MNNVATLGAFAVGLTVVFAGAVGLGDAVGPIGSTPKPHTASHTQTSPQTAADGHTGDTGHSATAVQPPQGLASSADGYTLTLGGTTFPLATPGELAFRILGPDGHPVTDYTRTHDKDLHLIVVRRDGTGFQHLHPERDADGRWTVPLTLPTAGPYKVFTDSSPAGHDGPLTLAADLSVAGDFQPVPLPAVSRTAVVDGYTVGLAGDLVAGTDSRLVLTVSRNGVPVTDLQPYLAAYGHLVTLRVGDLAYLHTHPDGAPGDGRTAPGPDVTFSAHVPTAGSYHLYLDFQHEGVVRTAEFTASAGTAP